jgi:predicted dehydrogenase
MLKIGIAGIGFMGMIHWLAYQRVPGVQVAAICSRDQKRLAGDWRGIKGNFGPAGAKMDLSGVRKYERLSDMLADPDLDAIDICLPPRMHCAASLAALRAGKHVFCEKPIALEMAESKRTLKAASAAGKQLLIGHIVPFFPEYAFVLAAAESGRFGKLLGGHFKRVIAEPTWIPNYFDRHEVGGPLLDLHIHDAHFIRLLFGMPRAVFSRGRLRGEAVEYVETQFIGADESQVATACGGVIRQPGRSFNQAFEIHFEQATVAYDFAVIDGRPRQIVPLTVFDAKGGAKRPKLGSADPIDGFAAEIREVGRSLQRGKPSPILAGEFASDALVLCQKEAESVRTGRIIKV